MESICAMKSLPLGRKRLFDGKTFRWDLVSSAPPCPELSNGQNPYIVKDPGEACWAVMFRGCCALDGVTLPSTSLLGKYGHLERANAWTHAIACVVFLAFAVLRPFWLGFDTTADYMATLSIVFTAITFAVSTVYHVYSSVPGLAPAARTLDHASIALSLACATVADLCMVTKNFQNVSFQAWLDPLIGSFVLILYFGLRRFFVPENETLQSAYGGDGCTLGLYRVFHSDLEHAALRAAGSAALTISWVLLIPSAVANLGMDPAVIWIVGASIGTFLLIFGILLDNTGVVDDFLMRNKRIGPCSCNSQLLGCVFNTHALWHVIATAGAASSIFAREYGIASWK